MLKPSWHTGILESVIQETPATRRFFIRVPDLEVFDFSPGQFVTLDLPIGDKPSQRWRSYSIASPPMDNNLFELLISLMPDGAGTHYLFSQMVPGAELPFRGPQGKFLLPDPIMHPLFFICTGTGVAPFRSMLLHLMQQGPLRQPVFLVFGCRRKDDLLYYEEMKDLEARDENFRYFPVLSRETWNGRHGYVHAVYEELVKERNKAGLEPASFYLCGWKNMISEAKERIQQLGYSRSNIIQEIYG